MIRVTLSIFCLIAYSVSIVRVNAVFLETTKFPNCKIAKFDKSKIVKGVICAKFTDYESYKLEKFQSNKLSADVIKEYEIWDDEEFQNHKKKIYDEAIKIGIDNSVAKVFMKRAKFIPKIKASDNNQADKVYTLSDYIKRRTAKDFYDLLIKKASEKQQTLDGIFKAIEGEFGVERSMLMSLWMSETNFSSFIGNSDPFSALTTLSFKDRRAEFFRKNLFYLMKLMSMGHASVDVKSSADGGLGGVQFMPQTFFSYGIDWDLDGKIDLFNSETDIMASASNYLHNVGWKKNEPILTVVELPDNFDYCNVGYVKANKRTLAQWKKLGVKIPKNDKFGQEAFLDNNRMAWLVMTDKVVQFENGCKPIAFLAYENFGALLDWNRSTANVAVLSIYNKIINDIE
jgi:membrane-bound lytic murein transglycosylase B